MNQASFLGNIDTNAMEGLYKSYLADKNSVDIKWQKFFEGFDFANSQIGANLVEEPNKNEFQNYLSKEFAVQKLVQEYRDRGHLFARTNPVRRRRTYSPTITIDRFGLTSQDLNTVFKAGESLGLKDATLKEIIDYLDATYCGSIGCEFNVINPNNVDWLTNRIEYNRNQPAFSKKQKLKIFETLTKAVLFEQFIHTRFIGQKRFSLEGLESLIPALQTVIEYVAGQGVKEFVIGMAHRGRLNVLANIFQKEYDKIFSEFEAKGYEDSSFVGDVKYHLGYSSDIVLENDSKIHLNIIPNPSHLEAVNPVVFGVTRGKLDKRYQSNQKHIVSVLIHGDSSIAGQGIIYEQMQMSQLPAYSAGGTVHIVINNQLGFTTNYTEARSSTYCTDVAKIGNCPVFHVNADDIEAVVHTTLIALDFRQKFNRDVFIDILGYRRHGHNEGDDPKFTQPILYGLIEKHPNALDIYSKKLLQEEVLSEKHQTEIKNNFLDLLDKKLEDAKKINNTPMYSYLKGDWESIRRENKGEIYTAPTSGVKKETLDLIIDKLTTLPTTTTFSNKIHTLLLNKKKAYYEKDKIDWATAEALAFGSLLLEKYHIRFSGQDVVRGTFSHRHSMLRSQDESIDYYPLKNLSDEQGKFMIFNSILSEYAVLGFEYGYALTRPDTLTLWEAQFGDFTNGAQIIIDQFIVAAETKWQRMNGIVLLLPHGQEGQGPEHSSARIERFLQMCAKDNIIVTNVSTPANYFHLLRRQMLNSFRKPLVVFTPKSLLRHPECINGKIDFIKNTSFQDIIDDDIKNKNEIEKILLCSGKIYYELLKYRQDHKIKNTAICRIEQLYPFDSNQLNKTIDQYKKVKKITWVQEEPARQGAMMFVDVFWQNRKKPLDFVSRDELSSTAPGFLATYIKEQAELIQKAFN